MSRTSLAFVSLLLALAVICAADVSIADDPPAKTPVIAELLATPGAFSGKTVTIYGLVVEVSEAGAVFLLQDVSQRPLRIVSAKGKSVAVGDQVLVRGVFRSDGGRHFLSAEVIQPAKVTGGG